MICPKCSAELPENAKVCTSCGAELHEAPAAPKAKAMGKKGILVGVIAVVFCALGLILALTTGMSKEEKMAAANCEEMKTMLKDPDSFRLYDIQMFECFSEDKSAELNGPYMFIEYGARNGYGGMVRSVAVFDEQGFLGLLDWDWEEAEENLPASRYGEFLLMKMDYLGRELLGVGKEHAVDGKWWEYRSVPIEKVERKMK